MISYADVQAVRDLDLPSHAKHILLELLFRANDRRICWPSLSTLASDTNLSKSTVRRMLRLLEERQLIQIEKNPTGGANNYMIFHMGGYHTDMGGYHTDMGGITQTWGVSHRHGGYHTDMGGYHTDMGGYHTGHGGYHTDTHEIDRKKKRSLHEREAGKEGSFLDENGDLEKIETLWNTKIYEPFCIDTVRELLDDYTADQIVRSLQCIQDEGVAAYRTKAQSLPRLLKRDTRLD